MSSKKRILPGVEHLDDFMKTVTDAWQQQFDGIDARAVVLFTRIFVLARLEALFYERTLAGTPRKAAEHYVLAMTRALGPRSPRELNITHMQTSGGLTKTLTRLEKEGLITREARARDRRSIEIRLTTAGRKEADRTMAIVGKAMHDRVGRLPKRKREEMTLNLALDDLIAMLLD